MEQIDLTILNEEQFDEIQKSVNEQVEKILKESHIKLNTLINPFGIEAKLNIKFKKIKKQKG